LLKIAYYRRPPVGFTKRSFFEVDSISSEDYILSNMRDVKKPINRIFAVILLAGMLICPLRAEEKLSIIVHLDNLYRFWFSEQYPTMNVDLWMKSEIDIKGVSLGFIIRNPLIEIDTVYTADFFRSTPINRVNFKNDTVLVYGDTVSYFHIGLVQILAPSIIPKNKFMKLATCRLSLRSDLFEDYPDQMAVWFDSTKIGRAGDFMLTPPDGGTLVPTELQIDTTFIFRDDFKFVKPPVRKGINVMEAKYRFLLELLSTKFLH